MKKIINLSKDGINIETMNDVTPYVLEELLGGYLGPVVNFEKENQTAYFSEYFISLKSNKSVFYLYETDVEFTKDKGFHLLTYEDLRVIANLFKHATGPRAEFYIPKQHGKVNIEIENKAETFDLSDQSVLVIYLTNPYKIKFDSECIYFVACNFTNEKHLVEGG